MRRYNLKLRAETVMRKLPEMNADNRLKTFLPKKRANNRPIPTASSTSVKRRAVARTNSRAKNNERILDSQSSMDSCLVSDAAGNLHLSPAPSPLKLSPDVDPDEFYRGYIHPSRRMAQALPPDPEPFRQLPTSASSSVPLIDPSPPCLSPPASPVPSSQLSPSSSPVPTQSTQPNSQSQPGTNNDDDYTSVMIALGDLNRLSRYLFCGGAPVQQHWDPTGVPTTREDVVEVLLQLRDMLHNLFSKFPDSRFA